MLQTYMPDIISSNNVSNPTSKAAYLGKNKKEKQSGSQNMNDII